MKRWLLWDTERKNYLQFIFFAALALGIHAVQIGLRVMGHGIFLALQAGDPGVRHEQWTALSQAAQTAEILFSLLTILFFVWIGLRLLFLRIKARTVLIGTAAAFLLLFAVYVPVSLSARLNPDYTSNVLHPLFFALLRTVEILTAAFLLLGLMQIVRNRLFHFKET